MCGAAPARAAEIPAGEKPKLEPRGVLVITATTSSGTFFPGPYALLLLPPRASRRAFFVSPANTVLGFGLSPLPLGPFEVSGALDVALRSPESLVNAHVLAPVFYDVHVQAALEHLRLIVGWYPDVVVGVLPDTLNLFPTSYLPGAIGYARPQALAAGRIPIHEESAQVIVQVSASTPITTFQVGDELVGRQAGVPDGQARLAFALGDSPVKWQRPFEVGVEGHVGRRRILTTAGDVEREFRTWSAGADLRAKLPWGTTLKARVWRGSALGDYNAGVLQNVSVAELGAIRAQGWFVTVRQAFGERWKASAGYGQDDPRDADLDVGGRAYNQAYFANASWDFTRVFGLGAEVSRWRTAYLGVGITAAVRADLLFFLRF